MKSTRSKMLALLVILGCSLNIYYYREAIWNKWAQYYLKDQDIIVSLTTTPHRIKQLEVTMQCLAHQNIKPRQIYVSVPHIFKRDNLTYEIPEWLDNYPNVTILRTEDYGPATKILGALKNAPITDNTIIIAVDDDTCYPYNLIARLAVRAKINPHDAIGVSGAILDFENNVEGGIVKVMHQDTASVPILEGFGGVAYRRTFFEENIYDISSEPDYCITSDDLYLSFHLERLKVNRQVTQNKFIKLNDIHQQQFGYNTDALYKLGVSQADRYKRCLTYLQNKYPEVSFYGNGIN